MSRFRPVMVNMSLAFSSQWSTRVECPVQPQRDKYSLGFIRGWLLESLSCARPDEGDRTQDVPLSEEVFVSLPAHQNECALFSLSSTDIAECSFINYRINNKTSYNTHIKQPIHQLVRVKQNIWACTFGLVEDSQPEVINPAVWTIDKMSNNSQVEQRIPDWFEKQTQNMFFLVVVSMRVTIKENKLFWFIFKLLKLAIKHSSFFVICAREMKVKTRKLSAVLLLCESKLSQSRSKTLKNIH